MVRRKVLLLLLAGCVLLDSAGQVFAGFEEAVAECKQIVASKPGTDEALGAQEKLVGLYVKAKMGAEAEAAYAAMLADFAGNAGLAEAVDHVSDEYREIGDYGKALELCRYVVSCWPDAEHAVQSQGGVVRLYIKLGDEPNAAAAMGELISRFGDRKGIAGVVDEIGDAYREAENYEKAREIYEYIVNTWPGAEHAVDSMRGVVRTSILLGDDGYIDTSVTRLLSDFGDNPEIAETLDHLADDFRESRRYAKARELYQYAVDHWPGAEHAVESLGGVIRTSILAGDDANAEEATALLLERYSGDKRLAKVVDEVADEYRKAKRYEKARGLYRYAIGRWPAAESAMDSERAAVLCSISLDDEPNAVGGIERLVADHNESESLPKLLHELARQYERQKKRQRARDVYESIVRKHPNSPAAEGARLDMRKIDTCELIRTGNNAGVPAELEKMVNDFNDHPDLIEALFVVGSEYYELSLRREVSPTAEDYLRYKKNAGKAIEVWKRIIDRGGDSILNGWAYNYSAICYQTLEEYDKAIDYLGVFLRDWPEQGKIRKAKFRVISCYEQLVESKGIGRPDGEQEIERLYGEIIAEEPGSSEAEIGKMWLKKKADGPFGMRRRKK